MDCKRNNFARFVLLSKLDSLEMIQNIQFSKDDRLWIIPVCCMADSIKDRAMFENIFCADGGEGTKYRNALIAKGADPKNISILNYFEVPKESCVRDILSSQYIVFTGGRMELGIDRLRKLGLVRLLQHYTGTIIGVSAGALMLFSEYLITPNYFYKDLLVCEGLGYIDGRKLMIEVHYSEDDPVQNQAIKLTCARRQQQIFAIRQSGYMIVRDGNILQCDGIWKS